MSVERDRAAEWQFHIDARVEDLCRQGVPRDEAERRARREFGDPLRWTEQAREISRMTVLRDVLGELRLAVRQLLRARGFATTVLLTLILGEGAALVIFSVLHAVVLNPLPYRDADRLLLIRATATVAGVSRPLPIGNIGSHPEWKSIQTCDVATYSTNSEAWVGPDGRELIDAAVVSSNFFSTVLGPIRAGRAFSDADAHSSVVVVSDRLARRMSTTPQQAVGQSIVLTDRAFTVVGVAAPEFQWPAAHTDVWVPQEVSRVGDLAGQIIARIRPGRTRADATGEATALVTQLVTGYREVHTDVTSLPDFVTSPVRPALRMLLVASLLVLVVTAASVSNLFLARQASRSMELAVRRALGASRLRLLAHALNEIAILIALGTTLALLLSGALMSLLRRAAVEGMPRLEQVRLDASTFWLSAAISLAMATAAAFIAVQGGGTSERDQLQTGSRAVARGSGPQSFFCTLQWSVSVILLVGALLLTKSLLHLLHTDLGVATDHVATASLNVNFGGNPSDGLSLTRINAVLDAVRALPGVRAAGVGGALPPSVARLQISVRRPGEPIGYAASSVPASPGYFAALQMRLLRGRLFTSADDRSRPDVVILSESTAKRFFGNDDPVGKTVELPTLRDGQSVHATMIVTGVVADVKYAGLTREADDVVYVPFAQLPWRAPFLVVRTATDPDALLPAIRKAVTVAAPDLVVSSERSLDTLLDDAVAAPRLQTVVAGAFAGLAVMMAAVSLFGLLAYAVAQRTREIGIRMALGADAARVVRTIAADALRVALVGLLVGNVAAIFLSRALRTLLYGTQPGDVLPYAIASALLIIVAIAAALVPARRASRVDPLIALRAE